jgi:hypothetical protein
MMMMMMMMMMMIIIICFTSRTFLTLARQLLKYKDTVLSDNLHHCKESSGWGEEFLGEVKDYEKLRCVIIATATLN